MINYIVADDEDYFAKAVSNTIINVMMRGTFEYKIHSFNDYNSNFLKIIDEPMANKIYILDIETKSASGLDMARKIRKNDINSIIIFITAHDELSSTVAKTQLMIMAFICKYDNFVGQVEEAILYSLKFIGKEFALTFNEHSTVYSIPMRDILYITHDSVERKCLIKTNYAVYKVNKSLSKIKEYGHGELIQSHRSCLINKSRIVKKDLKKNSITFDNGETIDLISVSYKKELV